MQKMPENGIKRPLLQDGVPPSGGAPRRFRRCRTAPSSDATQDHPPSRNQPATTLQSGGAAEQRPVSPREMLRGATTHPSFRLVGVLLLAYLSAGTTAFYLAMDHMSGDHTRSRVLDALYFCVVTMTTVGYGDLVPASDAAKLLACAFAFAGAALVGTFLSHAADYLVEKQEAILYRALHLREANLRAMEANKTRYKLYTSAALLAVALASGIVFLVTQEGMRVVDAIYCACATVTTLGYGDLSFTSAPGRAFAAAWVTVSTVVVALFFLHAAELGTERRQRALARWVLSRRTTSTDLEAADVDGDRRVGAADFVLYKLKELGKISQEEIGEFLDEFDRLDADNSGFLSPNDLVVAQHG